MKVWKRRKTYQKIIIKWNIEFQLFYFGICEKKVLLLKNYSNSSSSAYLFKIMLKQSSVNKEFLI